MRFALATGTIVLCSIPLTAAFAADDLTIKPYITDCKIDNRPPPPRTVCKDIAGEGQADPIKEAAKDVHTDNEVHINKDGSMTVCSTPVPLDAKCQPTRKGKILFCERLTGTERCRTTEKNQSSVGSALADQMELINTNQTYRDDLAAHALAGEVRQTILDAKSHPMTPLIDNFGFIEPYSPNETTPDGDISREVLAPRDRLEQIANDYDHLYATAHDYVQSARADGLPIQNPLIFAERSTLNTSSLVAQQHFMDDGTAIRYVRNIPIEQPLRFGPPSNEMIIQPYSFPVAPIPNPGANQWGIADAQPEQNISYSPGIISRTWTHVRSWFSW